MMLAMLSLGFSPAPDTGLRDHPIGAQSLTYLDGKWTATSSSTNSTAPSRPAPTTSRRTAAGSARLITKSSAARSASPTRCTVAVYDGDLLNEDSRRRRRRYAAATTASRRAAHVVVGGVADDRRGGAGRPAHRPAERRPDRRPARRENFLNSSLWAARVDLLHHLRGAAAWRAAGGRFLVFDGIKMNATIKLNGQTLGVAVDQFLQYTSGAARCCCRTGADAPSHLRPVDRRQGALHVVHRRLGLGAVLARLTHDALTFSKGIWKSVYLARPPAAVALAHRPAAALPGAYPTTPLVDGHHGGFTLGVRVFLSPLRDDRRQLALVGPGGRVEGGRAEGDSNVTLHANASATQVKLWWPAGMGGQPLYDLTVTFARGGRLAASASASRRSSSGSLRS